MDSGSQQVFMRMQLHNLTREQPEWKTGKLAQTLGTSERWVRKWLARFRTTPEPSIKMYLSRSSAPRRIHRKTSVSVKKKITDLRRELSETFHRKAGAKLILWAIKRHDDLFADDEFVPKSPTTITKILREEGYILRPKKRFRLPIHRPPPMEEWEIDFGEIKMVNKGKFEFFMAVDCGTSRIVYLEGSEGYDAESALEAIVRMFLLNGLPKRIRLDRDPRFVASWSSDSYPAALIRLLWVLGVKPIVCPPRRPDKKPFVERAIRTLKEEWLSRDIMYDIGEALRNLEGFEEYYNGERPHQGSACNNQTPDEAFPELPSLPRLPETVDPDLWLKAYHKRGYRRRITSNGTIQIDKHIYYIDIKRSKQPVLALLDADKKLFHVLSGDEHIASKPIKGVIGEEMDFWTYLVLMKQEARSMQARYNMLWRQKNEVA